MQGCHDHSIIIKVTFSFPKFVSACKKICSIHQVTLEIQHLLGSYDLATPIFDHEHPKTMTVTSSFPEFELTC